ncbi:MAG TPA: biotin/lipoyl-binding protein [Candidatus Dormibacteraeota bacterium]
MSFSWRTLLQRRVLVVLVAVTGLLGASMVYVQAAKITTTYRTAVVTYGTITQSIGMAGNLSPVSEADLSFASAGTVQSVDVVVGQSVPAGATLAALDPTLLSAQLLQAQATLATAESKLAQDQAGPTAQSLTSSQNSVGAAQVSVNNAQTSLTDTQAINAQAVAAAQAPVTTAQNAVNADLTPVNQDQTTLATDTATMNTDCNATPPAATCSQDTATVAADKAKLAADEVPLAKDQATLASVTTALNGATVKAQQSNDQAAAQLATARQQLASAQSSLSALSTSVSPQTIQIDEAQIEIDQVNVNTYQHEVDGATLFAPIAGVVSQVNVKAGQAVTGGGTAAGATYAIVIYTPGAYEMSGTVSDSQVNLVTVGQTTQVVAAGSTQAILGKVTSIAPAATVTSGVATFAVTAQLTDSNSSIKPGISATASIVVNQVVHVLTVPTSAVHTTAAGSTVQVMDNGSPRTVSVQTGASDPTRTQIMSGLQLNQVVVIAVITSSVPSSGTGAALGTGGNTRGGGGGGFKAPAGG